MTIYNGNRREKEKKEKRRKVKKVLEGKENSTSSSLGKYVVQDVRMMN